MDAKAIEVSTLDQLILEAKNNDAKLYDMSLTFIYLMASSNIEFINEYRSKVLPIIEQWKGSFRIANALHSLVVGYSHFFLSNPQEGLKEFDQLFEKCDETSLFNGIKGAGFMGRAICYRGIGRFDKTMENCLQGFRLIDPANDPEVWHIYLFRMLGEIHTYIGEHDEAVNYYLKAVSVMDRISATAMTTAQFRINDALGICYMDMGKPEEAEKYLLKALGLNNLSYAEQARVLCDLGILYLTDPSKALGYFEQSCDIRKEASLEDAYTTSLIYKAECFLKLGEIEKADHILKEAVPLVDKYNVPSKRLHLYQQLAALHEQNGQYKKANEYLHLYNELKTQIQLEQNKNIFGLKNKLIADQHREIEQKHSELKSTLSELANIKVSRKALIFTIITVVVLVILTEVFLEPIIEQYSMNEYINIGSKILIAFMLKPIDSLYERLLFRRAYRKH